MRWADQDLTIAGLIFAMVAAAVAGGALTATANQSTYGKVDTFEPGKKYNCLPSADRKGWDCGEAGKTVVPHDNPAVNPPEPAATPTPAEPPPAATRAVTTPPPAAATPARADALPSYLGNSAAGGSASAPAPTAKSRPPPVQPIPSAAPPAKPLPTPAQTAPSASMANSGNRHDFVALPGDHYVIELAHAEHEADVARLRASLHLPRGEVYELHLRHNGGDWWLLVWASFDTVDAARAARAELPTSINAGWPRRIAPLQAEVRRASQL